MNLVRMLALLLVAALLPVPVSTGQTSMVPEGEPLALLLVLAVDVSRSIKPERWMLQKNAYAAAFRDPEILETIIQVGGIAVTLVQWSDGKEQEQTVGWQVIKDRPSGESFAAVVERMERKYDSFTSISDAIMFCATLIENAPYRGIRRVIDVSGDGPHNDLAARTTVAEARAYAVKRNITINGLPMDAPNERREYNEDTIQEYTHNVIGGPGAFLIHVHNAESPVAFFEALKQKLFLEISAQLPVPDTIHATR